MKRRVVIYSLLLSFLFLLLATKSSPLYVFNDWGDANAFFTMGKGLMNGMVPYRDLFEQKGPILYLIYGIGYLFSHQTFLGIYILEVLAFTLVLVYFYKILKLYQWEDSFYLFAPIFLTSFLTMRSFFHGGSVEEFTVPFLLMSLYHVLVLLKEDHYLSKNHYFWIDGILAGIVFWMKYTLVGFWIGYGLLFLFLFLKRKEFKKMFSFLFQYLGGMILLSIPIFIYFGIHHALGDLWYTYFYLNIFLYHAESMVQNGLLTKIGIMYYLFTTNLKNHAFYSICLALGAIFLYRDKVVFKKKKWVIPFLFIILYFFAFLGCVNYRYYFFIMSPFLVFGILWMIQYSKKNAILKNSLLIFILPLCFFYVYAFNDNIPYLSYKKEDYAQYTFLEEIHKKENPTLLYYGGIDAGFYLTADIIPQEKYFSKINISYFVYPDNVDAERKVISSASVDFVIVRTEKNESISEKKIPDLEKNYQLVKTHTQEYEGREVVYFLFKKQALS